METLKQILDIILRPEIFPFYFIGLWVVVSFFLAKKSGWSKLKEKFPLNDRLVGVTFHTGSGNIGGVKFIGALKVATTNGSLILKSNFPGRIGHPPLRIPWTSITMLKISGEKPSQDNIMNLKLTEPIKRKAFYAKYAKVTLLDFPDLKMTIPWHDSLNQQLPRHFQKKIV